MSRVAIIVGLLLIVVGGAGYFAGGEHKSVTAWIPAMVGLPILICGLVARRDEYRKHAMHVAVIFGLLGFLAPLGRIIPQAMKGTPPQGVALVSMLVMMALCGVFAFLCVQSFIQARRARQPS